MPELPSCEICVCAPWEPLKRTVCVRGVRAPAPNGFELFGQAENECGLCGAAAICVGAPTRPTASIVCVGSHRDELVVCPKMSPDMSSIVWNDKNRDRLCAHTHMSAVGFEPTSVRTGAWSQRLRPLGKIVFVHMCTEQWLAFIAPAPF